MIRQEDHQRISMRNSSSPHRLSAIPPEEAHGYYPQIQESMSPVINPKCFDFPSPQNREDLSPKHKAQSSRTNLTTYEKSAPAREVVNQKRRIPRHSPQKYSTIRGQIYNYTSMQQYSKKLVDIKSSIQQTEKYQPLATAGQQQMMKFKTEILTSPANRAALNTVSTPQNLLITLKGGKLDTIDLSVLQSNYPSKEIELYNNVLRKLKGQDLEAIKQALMLENLGLQITPYQHTKNGVTGKMMTQQQLQYHQTLRNKGVGNTVGNSTDASILSSIESTGRSACGSHQSNLPIVDQDEISEEYKIEVRLGSAHAKSRNELGLKKRGSSARKAKKAQLREILEKNGEIYLGQGTQITQEYYNNRSKAKIIKKQPYSLHLPLQTDPDFQAQLSGFPDPYGSTSQIHSEAIDLLADSLHIQKCEMNKLNIEELINSLPRSVKISPPDDWPPPHLRKEESKEKFTKDKEVEAINRKQLLNSRKTYSKGFPFQRSPNSSEVSTAASNPSTLIKRKPGLPKVPLKKKTDKDKSTPPPPVVIPRKPRPPVQPRRKAAPVQESEYSSEQEEEGEEEPQAKRRKPLIFSNTAPPGMYTFIVQKGNSSHLVSQALARRNADWIETHHFNTLFHFKWAPVSHQIKFERMSNHSYQKQMVNHFQHHWQISTKDYLFTNMLQYCELNKRNVFDIVPLTFVVQVDAVRSAFVLEKFSIYFNIIQTQIDLYKQKMAKQGVIIEEGQDINDPQLLADINRKLQTFVFSNQRRAVTHTRPGVPHSHFAGQNIWLLKPTSYNRGRGVHLFNTIEQLKKLLKEMTEGQKMGEGNTSEYPSDYVKTSSFVIQKYIERPLLIQGRKFDIRQWILVTQDLDCYFFKEGYVRTSANEFALRDIDKRYVHLTNNAVQKYADNYGQFEEGNILSFQHFQEFFPEIDVREVIVEKMQEVVTTSMLAVRKKLNSNDRTYCFEIFGYDFMVDQNFKVWLIEVNTNPCMEESNAYLKMLLPRMVDDALKLTLDTVFPQKRKQQFQQQHQQNQSSPTPQRQTQNGAKSPQMKRSGNVENDGNQENEKRVRSGSPSPYPVDGHEDDENMWEFLVALHHPQITTRQRIANYCTRLKEEERK